MFLKRVAPLCAVLALLVASLMNHGIALASQDEGDGSFSVLMATGLVVPNAGYFFVVDFDTQNATTVARTGGAAVPPNVPRNGFFYPSQRQQRCLGCRGAQLRARGRDPAPLK